MNYICRNKTRQNGMNTIINRNFINIHDVRVKVILLLNQAANHEDCPFLISTVDDGERSVSPAILLPTKGPLIPIRQEAWCAPELVWMLWKLEKFLASLGNRTSIPLSSNLYSICVPTELSRFPMYIADRTKVKYFEVIAAKVMKSVLISYDAQWRYEKFQVRHSCAESLSGISQLQQDAQKQRKREMALMQTHNRAPHNRPPLRWQDARRSISLQDLQEKERN